MNTGVGCDAVIPFSRNVVYCVFNFKWQRHMSIFVVRLLLILCISSTVSCSLNYNEIVIFRCHLRVSKKKTQHLSTLGEKQSQHFAVSSY